MNLAELKAEQITARQLMELYTDIYTASGVSDYRRYARHERETKMACQKLIKQIEAEWQSRKL